MTTATMMTQTRVERAEAPSVVGSVTAAPLHPRVEFPQDPGLSDLQKLFSPVWVFSAYHSLLGEDDPAPVQFRIRQVSYTPGRVAIVSYFAEWDPEAYLPSQHFIARAERGRPVEVFQFPNDGSLPGLAEAVDPGGALKLVNRHIMAIGARRMRVEVVRYRPGSRAVLRHHVGRTRFYARVMRPHSLSPFLRGWEVVARSSFVAPRIAGHWVDGAVVWMSEIPGRNLRPLIRRGIQSDPTPLLCRLETLWTRPEGSLQGQPFNLSGAYRRAKRSFMHLVRETDAASLFLRRSVKTLDPFVESWRPSTLAHNDFYDDQILVLPDGGMALVDFEEAGPGDPMLDVGNFVAHLRWSARFGRAGEADATASYLEQFRSAAIERFGWNERDLNLREAVCLFRICTNAVRHPRDDWRGKLESGLSLVSESLE